MSTFDPEWNKKGLYYIPSENGYIAYFLKRSWGNYLFFPHPEVEKMYPFILASGGIYKIFDHCLPYPFYNKTLFDKFGAPTIGTSKDYHEDFLIEKYPEDYFDIDLTINSNYFTLKTKDYVFEFIDGLREQVDPSKRSLYRILP